MFTIKKKFLLISLFLLFFVNYYIKAQIAPETIQQVKQLNNKASKYLQINLKKAEFYAQRAFDIAKSQNFTIELARSCEYLGEVAFARNNFEESIYHYIKSLNVYQKNQDREKIANIYLKIAKIYIENKTFKQAEKYLNKALALCQKQKKDCNKYKAFTYNLLGIINKNAQKEDEAYQYFLKASEIFEENENSEIIISYINIAEIFALKKEFIKTKDFFGKAFKIAQVGGDKKYLLEVYFALGKFYFTQKQYEQARQFLLNAVKLSNFLVNQEKKADVFLYISKVYEKQGAFNKSLFFYKKYKVLNDSIFTLKQYKAIAQIESKYESKEKERENQLLKDKEKKQQEVINTQHLAGIMITITLFLLLIFISNLIFTNRNKQKINKALKTKQEEILEKNEELEQMNQEVNIQYQAMTTQNEYLEEIDAVKNKLFSIISHDLRSPLNSLKGFLDLLGKDILSLDEVRSMSQSLTQKTNYTLSLLDNLLNWAESQMQGIISKPENININDITQTTLQPLSIIAETKGIHLKNYCELETNAYADPNMINLVIRNLVANAIKFTPNQGEITVSSHQVNDTKIQVCIKDTGVGMSQQQTQTLFTKKDDRQKSFNQSTLGTNQEKGTGLGLVLCQEFVEKNNGRIWVESEVNKGSKFCFELPNAKI